MPAHIVVGLGYGDEGKGLVTDHLVRSTGASGVIRFNGGAQAAHNVVAGDKHHTFNQFSSGTLAGAMTYLSKYMLVNPHVLFDEWERLRKIGIWPEGKIAVQKGALVTTPFHIAANRIREIDRAGGRHGSCGLGIGETVMMAKKHPDIALRVEDLQDPQITALKLMAIHSVYRVELDRLIVSNGLRANHVAEPIENWSGSSRETLKIYEIFAKVVPLFERFNFDPDEHIVFEGAQGVLLDQFYGFHPHTTWSDTTTTNAERLLNEMGLKGYKGEVKKIGVMRSYMTRHGRGPFVTEDSSLREDPRFAEAHNGQGEWQGSWRVGWTDLRAMMYSLDAINGVDELAVTHLDRVEGLWQVAMSYSKPLRLPWQTDRQKWLHDRAIALHALAKAKPLYHQLANATPEHLVDIIEATLKTPVTIRGFGPTHEDIKVVEHA
jgi:adenylosuccinate synthase